MKEIGSFIKKRVCDNDSVFWMYFVVIVCGVGGAGIWANVFPTIVCWNTEKFDIAHFAGAVYTFFPPVLAGACADLLLSDQTSKVIRMFATILLILTFSWLMLCANLTGWWSAGVGMIGWLGALFMWIVANGHNPIYKQAKEAAENAVGGNQDVSGNGEGYNL